MSINTLLNDYGEILQCEGKNYVHFIPLIQFNMSPYDSPVISTQYRNFILSVLEHNKLTI